MNVAQEQDCILTLSKSAWEVLELSTGMFLESEGEDELERLREHVESGAIMQGELVARNLTRC